MPDHADDNESFCVGDIPFDEVDWPAVERLQHRFDAATVIEDDDERNLTVLGILTEMHGDDLVVL